jgi:hypothetical protein
MKLFGPIGSIQGPDPGQCHCGCSSAGNIAWEIAIAGGECQCQCDCIVAGTTTNRNANGTTGCDGGFAQQ